MFIYLFTYHSPPSWFLSLYPLYWWFSTEGSSVPQGDI